MKRALTLAALSSFAVILTLIGTGCGPAAAPTAEATPEAQDIAITDPSIGPEDAPVVIQEYGDFSCPSCAIWEAHGVRDSILEKYGDKVRFVWHDYAVLSPDSRPSAEAARCANEQGQFWEYHDTLYANYPNLGKSDLKKYAADLGLDTAQFDQCLDEERYFDAVAAGLKDGIDHGIFATPGYLVNDERVLGGQSLEVFSQAIDRALAGGQS